MVLVDSSVWIRFLANRAPYASELDGLLARDQVAGHDFVYGELILGDRASRRTLLSAYEDIHRVGVIPHDEVVDFIRARALHNRGIGWVDAHILASAIVGRTPVWTADRHLSAVARHLGIAYDAPSKP